MPEWSLNFYKRSKDASGKCTIHRSIEGVHFAIYAMDTEDRAVLDEIEGLGSGYDEITLHIPDFGTCFSYIAQDAFVDRSLVPYDWYKALVLAGVELHGFPGSYVRRIEATPAIRDPDPKRAAKHWGIVNKLITTHC
ncbi:MAG: hypothetical protein QNI98_00350 [Woeseiaceae bacterium]|nr:hypothetical protein [Woeseiaceae bacterium]